MWMQSQAAFMEIQPMQCGLQADRMPVSLKIHTSPSGQSATLLSPKPEPGPNQSKQILPIVRRAETQGSCKNLVVSVEITASASGKVSTYMICQENPAAFFFIHWIIMLNPTEP